jgi:uncharacterized protein
MPNSIVHFEIPADDLPRAKKFYEKVFNWKINDPHKMGYFFVETKKKGEEGINGGLMQRKMPGQPFTNYLMVGSIETSCEKVIRAGGTIIMTKMEVGPQMGWIAAFKDTEGNILGFYQAPKKLTGKNARKKVNAKKK